jgi:hypothetical protein
MLLASRSMAQSSISGVVTDEAGAPIAGASIVLKGENIDWKGRADEYGIFKLAALHKGRYEVSTSHIGYSNFYELVILKSEPIAMKIVLLSKSSELLH